MEQGGAITWSTDSQMGCRTRVRDFSESPIISAFVSYTRGLHPSIGQRNGHQRFVKDTMWTTREEISTTISTRNEPSHKIPVEKFESFAFSSYVLLQY